MSSNNVKTNVPANINAQIEQSEHSLCDQVVCVTDLIRNKCGYISLDAPLHRTMNTGHTSSFNCTCTRANEYNGHDYARQSH